MERILELVRKVFTQTWNLGEKRWNRHRGMRVILPVIDLTVASRVLWQELVPYTANTLKDMIQCRPQSRIDGMRNVWILKPGDKSLGRGIVLKNSLSDILNKVNHAARECMQYVVQKYIGESCFVTSVARFSTDSLWSGILFLERPLLVHKTKVDVRQWFLITSTQPLVVWMYKYRFSSPYFCPFLIFPHRLPSVFTQSFDSKRYLTAVRVEGLHAREFPWIDSSVQHNGTTEI